MDAKEEVDDGWPPDEHPYVIKVVLQVMWNGNIYKGRVRPNISMRFLLER